MKKMIFTVFLILCIGLTSRAQTIVAANEFYTYLNSVLKDKNNKSIQLSGINYGAMGSKFNWEAILKNDGKKIEIQYKNQKPVEDNEKSDEIVLSLDTTFVTPRKKLIQNFKTEITAVESRPVYFEEIVKVVVTTEHSNKEFILKRADGLSFLLRYDKSFEEYYKERNEKRKSKE
jgi:hypothetical protein